jgi:hypothetical protein
MAEQLRLFVDKGVTESYDQLDKVQDLMPQPQAAHRVCAPS